MFTGQILLLPRIDTEPTPNPKQVAVVSIQTCDCVALQLRQQSASFAVEFPYHCVEFLENVGGHGVCNNYNNGLRQKEGEFCVLVQPPRDIVGGNRKHPKRTFIVVAVCITTVCS